VLILPENPSSSLSIRAKAVVFEDPASRALLNRIERVAPSDATVLITGETGTGKELVARQLHALSRRAEQPFVGVNAGAFSETLIESELFGHEKGAFTGAYLAKAGWFEAAHGGTLFLDEIGDLPLSSQVKLLRVLQECEVTRIGSRIPTPIDVRLIAATNVDLHAAIRAKRFREDLYYRLNVASLTLPPLRRRPRDILALASHFIDLYERRLGQHGVTLAADAAACLLAHHWPGNIRELENAIHQALLVHQGPQLRAEDFALGTSQVLAATSPPMAASDVAVLGPVSAGDPALAQADAGLTDALTELLDCGASDLFERVQSKLFSIAYHYCGDNQLETARRLGISRNVVRARLIAEGALKGPLRRGLSTAPQRALPLPRLRIGYQKLGLLMVVKGYGAFDAALAARGIAVDWVEYAGGIQLVEALQSGELAAGVVGDCPAVFAQAEDVPFVYLAAEPPAPRGTALIVRESSSVRSVAQLRGKRVAVHRGAQAHYLLIKALEEVGVRPDELEICFEPPERALRAFGRGEVDGWAVWDPWLSSALLDVGARVLRDSAGLMNNSVYYLARRDFAEGSPELVRDLLTHVDVAAQWAKRDPARAAAVVAPDLGFSSRAMLKSLQRELCTMPVSPELIAAQQTIADTLLRLQLIPRRLSIADAQWHMARTA
jgi:aliphatic sulfonates family ABC transporter substrate-binding protein